MEDDKDTTQAAAAPEQKDAAPAAPEDAGAAAQPTTDPDAAAAKQARDWFNEDLDTSEDAEDATRQAAEDKADQREAAAATEEDDGAADEGAQDTEEQPEAPADAEERAEKPDTAKEKAPDQAPATPEPDAASRRVFNTDRLIADAVAAIPEKVKVGDKEVPTAEFLKDFPEVKAVVAAMAADMIERAVGPVVQYVNQQMARQKHDTFMGALEEQMPGARRVVATKDFGVWMAKQPDTIKQMARVSDVSSASVVLKLYRAENPGAFQRPGPSAAAEPPPPNPVHERKKMALVGTLGTRPTSSTKAPRRADPNDYRKAFNEG